MPKSSRQEWISYIPGFQKKNGLSLDPMIETPLAEEVDWWGWRHLTLHALMALAALGGSAQKRFELLRPFKNKGYISTWLESRNWRLDPASVSNEIQNHAVMLQYARDFQGETWCEDSLRDMFDWLDKKQDPKTGLWGECFNNKHLLSNGVQAGYHLWLLYFYDSRPIRHVDPIIDKCLATQKRYAGFGVRLHPFVPPGRGHGRRSGRGAATGEPRPARATGPGVGVHVDRPRPWRPAGGDCLRGRVPLGDRRVPVVAAETGPRSRP